MLEWKCEIYCGFNKKKRDEMQSLLEHNGIPCKAREKNMVDVVRQVHKSSFLEGEERAQHYYLFVREKDAQRAMQLIKQQMK